MGGYRWNFSILRGYVPALLAGAAHTVLLLLSTLALSVPLGLLFGLLRQSRLPVLSQLAVAYIEFFRTSIALVLVCWFYYAAPIALHLQLSPLVAVTLALGLQNAAFTAELIRAGLNAVPRGQWEAGRALGMGRFELMRSVVLSQALRYMLPLFFVQIIEVLKNTALAGVVAYPELFYAGLNVANTTYRPIETMTLIGAGYFVVLFVLGRIARGLEWHFAKPLERA